MFEVLDDLEPGRDDAVGLLVTEVHDEADAASIVLARGIVEPGGDRPGRQNRFDAELTRDRASRSS
jgi:hypothetical protein